MIVEKSYSLELKVGANWVACGFESFAGSFDERSVPVISGTLVANMPASVALTSFTPFSPAKFRLTSYTPNIYEFPILYVVSRELLAGRVYRFEVASEDGLLIDHKYVRDPDLPWGAPPETPKVWRQHETLEQLVPAVCEAVGMTVASTMPTAGVAAAPAYKKENLILNPTHQSSGSAWGALGDTGYTPGSGKASFHQLAPTPTATVNGFFHADTEVPSVPDTQRYKLGCRVNVPAALVGKKFYLSISASLEVGTVKRAWSSANSDANYSLTLGVQDIEFSFALKNGHTVDSVGFVMHSGATTTPIEVTRAWLTQSDYGDPPNEFFYGATTDDSTYSYDFDGDAHKSRSIRFPVEERALEVALQVPGEDYWGVLSPHLAKRAWRIAPAAGRTWQVRPTGSNHGEALFIEQGKWLSYEERTSRNADDWGDSAVLVWRWQTRHGAETKTETYIPWASAGLSPHIVNLDEPFVGYGAAANYGKAAYARGTTVQLELPLDFAIRPGRMLNLQNGIMGAWSENGVINRITFDTDSDTMALFTPGHTSLF